MDILTRFRFAQQVLLPELKDLAGPLSPELKLFAKTLATAELDSFLSHPERGLVGCPRHSLLKIFRAFIAKAIFNLTTTRALLHQLAQNQMLRMMCGWEFPSEIPSEATFSRAFTFFAQENLAELVRQNLVKEYYEDRVIGHVSRDSSDIPAREKATPVKKDTTHSPRKRGRPRKGEEVDPKPQRRIERQQTMDLPEMLADLPKNCDFGSKKKGERAQYHWKGYKIHCDVSDEGIVLSAILTSASVHDSQCGLPLIEMTGQRFNVLYELMDSAYDVEEIKARCRALGHLPIIDENYRRNTEKRDAAREEALACKVLNITYPEEIRYKIRTVVERTFSRLKDEFGARMVRYRGTFKVACHLSFGLLALTIDQCFST
jgi:hypothetical protein